MLCYVVGFNIFELRKSDFLATTLIEITSWQNYGHGGMSTHFWFLFSFTAGFANTNTPKQEGEKVFVLFFKL